MSKAESCPTPVSTAIDPDLSGRQLGDYRILRRLGRGGMAEVYLAEQSSLARQVAIKVLKSSLATDDKYVRRFHVEAQAAASLVHANIVQIHEVGCIDGIHFIVQEYVAGPNLREYLSREGPPDVKVSLKVMRHVAAALVKAAEKGIVHRDIKPENIMLARSGEVKVADFGLARRTREDALHLTQIGQTMGTPLYMSPEQVEGKPLDPRSDIYSLGVTCYHMLTGSPPFRGETALNVAVQHLKTQPERLETLRPELPKPVCRIVHKMLAKDPAHRYANARELLRELRAVRVEGNGDEADEAWEDLGLEVDTSPVGRSEATQRLDVLMKTTSQPRLAASRGWIWGGCVAIAFLLGGVAAWSLRPRSLLADAAAPQVQEQESAAAQLLWAEGLKTEDAWRAVIDYFPDPKDAYFANRARQELAMIYLQRGGAEQRALEYFNQLANLDAADDVEFKAIGLAGQAIVLSLEKKHLEASKKLAELRPIVLKIRDRRLSELIFDVQRENERALHRQADAEWEKLREQLTSGQEPVDNRPEVE
jgi:serine/threonine-protein kinase